MNRIYEKDNYEWEYFGYINKNSPYIQARNYSLPLTPENFDSAAVSTYDQYEKNVELFVASRLSPDSTSSHRPFMGSLYKRDRVFRKSLKYGGWTKRSIVNELSKLGYQKGGFHNFSQLYAPPTPARRNRRMEFVVAIPSSDIKFGKVNALNLSIKDQILTRMFSMGINSWQTRVYYETLYRSLMRPSRFLDWNKICSDKVLSLDSLEYIANHELYISKEEISSMYNQLYLSSILTKFSNMRDEERLIFLQDVNLNREKNLNREENLKREGDSGEYYSALCDLIWNNLQKVKISKTVVKNQRTKTRIRQATGRYRVTKIIGNSETIEMIGKLCSNINQVTYDQLNDMIINYELKGLFKKSINEYTKEEICKALQQYVRYITPEQIDYSSYTSRLNFEVSKLCTRIQNEMKTGNVDPQIESIIEGIIESFSLEFLFTDYETHGIFGLSPVEICNILNRYISIGYPQT